MRLLVCFSLLVLANVLRDTRPPLMTLPLDYLLFFPQPRTSLRRGVLHFCRSSFRPLLRLLGSSVFIPCVRGPPLVADDVSTSFVTFVYLLDHTHPRK